MSFLIKHAAILLYAGFWISLSGYGLLAPPERVRLLESGLVTQGWHLSLISLLSASSAEVQGAAAAVLGNLSSVPEFRDALLSDGALQPILQLLHTSALPARTAAVRALAIMSQQLMSPSLPADDAGAAAFVDAFFAADALPTLLAALGDRRRRAGRGTFTGRGVKKRCSQVWLARQASVLGARLEQGIAEATLEAAEPHCIRKLT